MRETPDIDDEPGRHASLAEYSVVSQDDFGQRAQIELNVIPVIPSLVQKAIPGGS